MQGKVRLSISMGTFAVLVGGGLLGLGPPAGARCGPLFRRVEKPILTQGKQLAVTDSLTGLLREGQTGVRILSKNKFETPDPAIPRQLEFPDGKTKIVFGVSGQKMGVAETLQSLGKGGVKPFMRMRFYNRHGHEYGAEVDQQGRPIAYKDSSALWDGSFAHALNKDGSKSLVMFAGAMADDPLTGRPYTMASGKNPTRQRMFFKGKLVEDPVGSGEFTMVGTDPWTPLNEELPDEGKWTKERSGRNVFRHGYGGGPVTLSNGDLYFDELGRVPFVFDGPRDQTFRDGAWVPGATVMWVAYMDASLTRVLSPPEIILDPFKTDGSAHPEAERTSEGFGALVEGGNLVVMNGDKPIASHEDLMEMRRQNRKVGFKMFVSMGQYHKRYGSFLATSEGGLNAMKFVLDEKTGRPLDITAPLGVLFLSIGRPAPYFTGGQMNLLVHGVPIAWLPEGFQLSHFPKGAEWDFFHRQIISVPLKNGKNGQPEIDDNTGLLPFLKRHGRRPFSMLLDDPARLYPASGRVSLSLASTKTS